MFRNVLEVLTAQSLLVALGMGSTPGALPLTAATKWVLKDGVGSFATLFAGSLGGQRYDEDPKQGPRDSTTRLNHSAPFLFPVYL